MACFIVPAVAAMAVSAVNKKIPQKFHPEWLLAMLWGGTVMLIVDHISNGEIVPFYPYLTGADNPAAMFREIITLGGAMTLAVFIVWMAMVLIANKIKRASKSHSISN